MKSWSEVLALKMWTFTYPMDKEPMLKDVSFTIRTWSDGWCRWSHWCRKINLGSIDSIVSLIHRRVPLKSVARIFEK